MKIIILLLVVTLPVTTMAGGDYRYKRTVETTCRGTFVTLLFCSGSAKVAPGERVIEWKRDARVWKKPKRRYREGDWRNIIPQTDTDARARERKVLVR